MKEKKRLTQNGREKMRQSVRANGIDRGRISSLQKGQLSDILEIVYIYSFLFNLCCESFTIKWFNSLQSIELCSVFGRSFRLYNTSRSIIYPYIVWVNKSVRASEFVCKCVAILYWESSSHAQRRELEAMTIFIIPFSIFASHGS